MLFVYNRPEHLKQTMETLQNNTLAAESELYIYSDAARKDTDEAAVAEVRNYIHKITGFKSITLIEREKNWGLARNIIDGVTTQVNRFGRVIVMEDDLITAPYFLHLRLTKTSHASVTYKLVISPTSRPYPIHFLSSLPEVGGGLLGTEHGNISIPTGKSCSANWKNVTSHGDLTSTGIILSREC